MVMVHRMAHLIVLFMGIAVLLSVPMASAKALGTVTISGEGIDGEITLTNPYVLDDLIPGLFEDYARGVLAEPPEVEGEGYAITRWLDVGGGEGWLLDRVRFYPRENGTGYVYYEAWLDEHNKGGASSVGNWYYASNLGDLTMHRIIADPEGAVALNEK